MGTALKLYTHTREPRSYLFIIFYLTQHPLPMRRENLERSTICRELHVRVSSLLPGEKIRLRFTLPDFTPHAHTSSPNVKTAPPFLAISNALPG
jgi:hypothetical protein